MPRRAIGASRSSVIKKESILRASGPCHTKASLLDWTWPGGSFGLLARDSQRFRARAGVFVRAVQLVNYQVSFGGVVVKCLHSKKKKKKKVWINHF